MDIFNQLFGGLVFDKVKMVNSYAMYAAKIQTFTGNGQRYVFLLVPFDQASLGRAKISQLPWASLQTRMINDNYSISEQSMNPKSLDFRYADKKIKITVKNRNYERTEYFVPLDIELSLLHDPKKKSMYQYNDSMDLRQALNTFQCIVKRL